MFLALLLSAGCSRGVDLEVAQTFQEAQKTFDQAQSADDFLRAAALYQSILDRGVVSGAVLYNQGNAYMQADERGRAIAAYRQARRYRPRDPYLQANLDFALGSANPAARRRPMIQYVFFWQDWLSYPGKFFLTGAMALLTFACGVVALFRHRRLLTGVATAGVVLTLLFSFSAGYDWYRFETIVHGVVVGDEVIARKGNGITYEPAFTEPLTEGTELRLLERRGGWNLVRFADGGEGWVEDETIVLY